MKTRALVALLTLLAAAAVFASVPPAAVQDQATPVATNEVGLPIAAVLLLDTSTGAFCNQVQSCASTDLCDCDNPIVQAGVACWDFNGRGWQLYTCYGLTCWDAVTLCS